MDCSAINSSPGHVLEGLGLTRKDVIYALQAKEKKRREKRVPPEPGKDQERVRVIVQHITIGKVILPKRRTCSC